MGAFHKILKFLEGPLPLAKWLYAYLRVLEEIFRKNYVHSTTMVEDINRYNFEKNHLYGIGHLHFVRWNYILYCKRILTGYEINGAIHHQLSQDQKWLQPWYLCPYIIAYHRQYASHDEKYTRNSFTSVCAMTFDKILGYSFMFLHCNHVEWAGKWPQDHVITMKMEHIIPF
mgnify:FL=1